jgi:hypothetical protein
MTGLFRSWTSASAPSARTWTMIRDKTGRRANLTLSAGLAQPPPRASSPAAMHVWVVLPRLPPQRQKG